MTDHDPVRDSTGERDDTDVTPEVESEVEAEAVSAPDGEDGSPPRLSGQPGWSAPEVTAALPLVPRQAEEPEPQLVPALAHAHAHAPGEAEGSPSARGFRRAWQELPPLPSPPVGDRPFASSGGIPRRGRLNLSRGALRGIVAAGVALAAVAVTAVVLTSGDSGNGSGADGPTGDGANVRSLAADWTLPGTQADHQVGTWVTGSYFVRATQSGVRAYKLDDGTPAWTAKPLSGPGVPCAMSPTVSASGVGTIGFGPDTTNCTTVVGIDTRTGRTLWSTPMTTKDQSAPAPTTTFLDGSVGVVVNDAVVGGVDLTDGHVVWGYKPRGQYCTAYPYGGAGAVLVDDYCADVSPAYVVTAFDAATGKEIWHRQGTAHVQFGPVLDAAPVAAALTDGTVNLYDATGTPRALTLADGFDPNLGAVGRADSGARALGPATLLLPSRRQTPSRAVITAVNTTTGATSWTYDGDGHQGAALVHPTQDAPETAGSKVLAVSLVSDFSQYGSPELVSLDPATGRSTVLAVLPNKPSSFVYTAGTVYALPDGRVLLVALDGTGTAVQMFK